MTYSTQGNTTVITQEKTVITELVKKIEVIYSRFKDTNIIINLLVSNQLLLEDVMQFSNLSNLHRKANKSFVIVTNKITIDDGISETLLVVPTLQEAHDIIEMEAIERDLF